MSSAGISFGGLASGMDTQAIIAALMAVEQRPIAVLEQKKTTLNKQKGLFGDIEGLLNKLATKAKALDTTADFLSMKTTVDDETFLTASASSSAAPGSHQIRVLTLAKAQVSNSNGVADPTANAAGATGSVIELNIGGETKVISIAANASLNDIAAAINANADGKVQASVVDTGQGATPHQLVVRGTETGSAGAFNFTIDSASAEVTALVGELNANIPVAATNASIVMNGITIQRNSNTIADVIPGVTLDLHNADLGVKTINITISPDGAETSKKVKEFVDTYNEIVDWVKNQFVLGEDGKAKNPLFGDSTLRSVRSTLRTIMGSQVATGNTAYSMLSQIGITSDRDGKLTFNEAKFAEALGEDEDAVGALFTDATNGIAKRIIDQTDVFTDSVDGLFKARKDGFDRIVKDTQKRIDNAEDRLDRYELQLKQKFSAMESMLSQLQGQGSALSGISSLSTRR